MNKASSHRGLLPLSRGAVLTPAFLGFCCRLVLAFLSISASRLPLCAQSATGAVEGRVQNAAAGDYLNNVRVALIGTDRVVFTDSSGFFRLADVPAGEARLRVSYTGQADREIAVQVTAGQTARQDIDLAAAGQEVIQLDSFAVVAKREMDAESLAINEQRYAENIKNVISADAFGDVSEGNVGEFIKRLPGVSINEAAGDAYSISLRGFAPELTPVSVDGNSIPSASYSATSVSRGSNLEQVSMSNVSRIEVIKSPIPSVSADSLGGSVNLISKSAFDRSRPQLTVRGTLQFTADDYELDRTPAPGNPPTRKLRPGYEISYVNPVTSSFGFTLSSLLSDQFGRLLGPTRTFEFAPAQGGSATAPYLRTLRTTDDARETQRQTFAGSIDWRPVQSLTLTLGARHIVYDLFTAPQRMTFNLGNNPVAYGADFTQGRTGAGSIVHQQIWTTKFGNTDHFSLAGRYREGVWKGDFSLSYAHSGNKYRDIDDGFFRGATTRLVSPTIRWEGFGGSDLPRTISVQNAAGAPIDWTELGHYQLVNLLSIQRNASDEIRSAQVNLRRELALGRLQGAIQIGGAHRKREVDRNATSITWNYVGPDGIALTADDSAAPYVDSSYLGVDEKFGMPRRIQWPDLRALYRVYQEHPSYLQLTTAQAVSAYTFEATNTERIAEEIDAAYVQGELSLLRNRLKLVGGVRFERTANVGVGLLRDRDAVYQRDAAGNLVRGANGSPVYVTNDLLARAKLEYIPRGLRAERSYDDYYPSLNASYTLLPELTLRVSYARTLGRPDFTNVVPNLDIIENVDGSSTGGQIVARNPSLQPWEADNYEISLEYYFKSSGVVSAGIFRKDIANGFGTQTLVLDQALLRQFELDSTYLGWDLQSTFNVGQTVRISGLELSYKQALGFLPSWARGFTAFANTTILDLDGPDSALSSVDQRTANWGLSYSRGRVAVGLNWNYLCSKTSSVTLGGQAGERYDDSRLTLDLTSEFRLTPKLSLFFNARNLTNTYDRQYRALPGSPDYSRLYTQTDRGAKLSAGIRGVF